MTNFKHSSHEYLLTKITSPSTWDYIIYSSNEVVSSKSYETRDEARQAAITHIDMMESIQK